jgi:hypothetical protein
MFPCPSDETQDQHSLISEQHFDWPAHEFSPRSYFETVSAVARIEPDGGWLLLRSSKDGHVVGKLKAT